MTALNHSRRGREAAARAAAAPLVSPGQCPPPELLRAEAEGVLPDDLAARVTSHRAACGLCARLQSALTSVDIDAPTRAELRRIRARIGGAAPSVSN